MKVLQVQTLLTYDGDYANPHCSVRLEKPRVAGGRDTINSGAVEEVGVIYPKKDQAADGCRRGGDSGSGVPCEAAVQSSQRVFSSPSACRRRKAPPESV